LPPGRKKLLISWKEGIIIEIRSEEPDLQQLIVSIEGEPGRAWNYPQLTGRVQVGDSVYLNTTAVELGLGSGGYNFVIANLTRPPVGRQIGPGHIMKMRYTPMQLKLLSVEEEESPYHDLVAATESLNGTPVVVGTLHSMLAPAVAGSLSCRAGLKIAYLMTDGAALPLALSQNVRILREKGWLAGTVTTGHAFGGDLEAVNIYSGLLAACAVWQPDLMIVTMGPGIVGTGTRWGNTALEQGQIINAVSTLGGRPVAIPRISFADLRGRHQGVSHHTLTALGQVALTPAWVALPELCAEQAEIISGQLQSEEIDRYHRLLVRDGQPAIRYLEAEQITVRSMGRGVSDDPAFFLAAGAAGILAAELVVNKTK
jgi:hypothetical protein